MSTPAFNPEDYISDKPLTAGEKEILNKALGRTKVGLFYENNATFLTSLVASMDFIWDRSIPTACTNGVFMAWNPEFYLSLSPKSRVTVLAHEAWHVAYQHMTRCGSRDPQDYNSAADYVINGMLEDQGFDMSGFPYLLDKKYKGMSTEEVYNDIHINRPGMHNPQNGDFAAPGNGPASVNQGMSQDQIRHKAQGNLHDAATNAKMTGGFGDLPGEIQQMIEEFLSPKLPWQAIFANWFEALSSVEYSYRSPNRRYPDPLLPGRTGRNGLEHIIYAIDISGSISDIEIVRFNSEVKYIKETYSPEKLTIITFDTKIHDIYVFEEDDEFDSISITGRGGTNLEEVFEFIREQQPTAAVIFTDLCVHIPEKEPGPPLVWICSGNPHAEVPFGTKIDIEEDDERITL